MSGNHSITSTCLSDCGPHMTATHAASGFLENTMKSRCAPLNNVQELNMDSSRALSAHPKVKISRIVPVFSPLFWSFMKRWCTPDSRVGSSQLVTEIDTGRTARFSITNWRTASTDPMNVKASVRHAISIATGSAVDMTMIRSSILRL